jgi:hypothetical protein
LDKLEGDGSDGVRRSLRAPDTGGDACNRDDGPAALLMLSSLGGGGGLLARVLLKNQCSSSSSSSAGEPFGGGGGGGGELMPALLCVGRGWMDDENGIVDGLLSCDDLPACFCLLLGCDELLSC